jgi:hypothetical protein
MQDSKRYTNNLEFLSSSVKSIKQVMMDLDERSRERFQTIQESSVFPDNELGANIITILNFNLFANTSWGIGYETNTDEEPDRLQSFISGLY